MDASSALNLRQLLDAPTIFLMTLMAELRRTQVERSWLAPFFAIGETPSSVDS